MKNLLNILEFIICSNESVMRLEDLKEALICLSGYFNNWIILVN